MERHIQIVWTGIHKRLKLKNVTLIDENKHVHAQMFQKQQPELRLLRTHGR